MVVAVAAVVIVGGLQRGGDPRNVIQGGEDSALDGAGCCVQVRAYSTHKVYD